ncbi:MAG: hypothetical protein M0Z60_11045 [Nitrospiraceae bacterium]|nr:hypothetical protein [Nitrospiraceae bacterium]
MAGRKIEVSCYAGYKGDERPRSFLPDGERVEVVSIIYEWIEERVEDRTRKRFFRVRGSDGFEHLLYYDEETTSWFLTNG